MYLLRIKKFENICFSQDNVKFERKKNYLLTRFWSSEATAHFAQTELNSSAYHI